MASLPDTVKKDLGIDITYQWGRFSEVGWVRQGSPDLPCPHCGADILHIYRKHYRSAGRDYHYWAIVCASCRTALALVDYPSALHRGLRSWSDRTRFPCPECHGGASALKPMSTGAVLPPGWEDLELLWFISPVVNLPSICQVGILSKNRAAPLQPVSLANQSIQKRRDDRQVGGRPLHDYANLFVNPRNAMMFRVLYSHGPGTIAVVGVDAKRVFGLSGVWVTERNAAAGGEVRAWEGTDGLAKLERSQVFATSWHHPAWSAMRDVKQLMMAEVLVPEIVPAGLLRQIRVANDVAARAVSEYSLPISPTVDNEMFFGWQ